MCGKAMPFHQGGKAALHDRDQRRQQSFVGMAHSQIKFGFNIATRSFKFLEIKQPKVQQM